MSVALIIIDVQTALCSGEYKTFDCENVIKRINLVSEKARLAGVPVILVQHESTEDELFRNGSPGWQLAESLVRAQTDILIGKKATDSFHKTELEETLRKLGVDRMVVCGMQSDFCVDTSIRRALALGYPVDLISDGHTTVDNGILTASQITAHHNQTLSNIESFGPRVRLIKSDEVCF